ncbi:uncharacterized protein LOC105697466 [Orussus abietinus]|uniref:uncharacterized protein LOC105697466 n=1 Tax=Orussus abietinus TaxID=222816 RepID=UPI000626C1D8|nr:uncharacterized protein LOC105697466 [Orussus abietinus]XP_012276237.1 uncharacterized protein LOC105697466 [Orussus abietinus]
MDTSEDIGSQLMKPVKDLAEWTFPLAEVLEKYCDNLNNSCAINFGEAALVLQNSSNVYIRRVEYLFNDAVCLQKSFLETEALSQNDSKKDKKHHSRRSVINFNDFEPIALEDDIGKNIHLKNHHKEGQSTKLLSRRFTQLENNIPQVLSSIQFLNIHGEVIGKKYDFRCNQHFTTSAMLVDEFTPDDPEETFTSEIINTELPNTPLDPFMEHPDTFGYYSDCSSNPCNNLNDSNHTDLYDKDLNMNTSNVTSQTLDSGYMSINTCAESIQDNCSDCDNRDDFMNLADNDAHSNVDISCDINDLDTTEISVNKSNASQTETEDYDLNNQRIENQSKEKENNSSCGSSNNEHSDESHELQNDNNPTDVRNDNLTTTADSNITVESNETVTQNNEENDSNLMDIDAGYTSADSDTVLTKENSKSNKEEKKSNNQKNPLKKQIIQPIAFENGVPEKLQRPRAEFKLPCPISLLKSRPELRKRKLSCEPKKQECLTRFLLNESETPRKKMTMYSPTRQFFTPMKKEDVEEFEKTFDECFKNSRCSDIYYYEAVTSITMDLLGFQSTVAKQDPHVNSDVYSEAISCADPVSTIESETQLSPFNMFTPPSSPSPSDTFGETSELPMTLQNYQFHIRNKVRDIFKDRNAQSELEQNVADWHQSIKPILKEAEQRSVFNITDYSSRVIDSLHETSDHRIAFDDMIQQESPAEAARYFLASLQLANTGSINVNNTSGACGNVVLALRKEERSRRNINVSEIVNHSNDSLPSRVTDNVQASTEVTVPLMFSGESCSPQVVKSNSVHTFTKTNGALKNSNSLLS